MAGTWVWWQVSSRSLAARTHIAHGGSRLWTTIHCLSSVVLYMVKNKCVFCLHHSYLTFSDTEQNTNVNGIFIFLASLTSRKGHATFLPRAALVGSSSSWDGSGDIHCGVWARQNEISGVCWQHRTSLGAIFDAMAPTAVFQLTQQFCGWPNTLLINSATQSLMSS